MKSGWFWQTDYWEDYQYFYYLGKDRPDEFKSSPLAQDHDFISGGYRYTRTHHQTQVIDLTQSEEALWASLRKSYHSIIHRAQSDFIIEAGPTGLFLFQQIHEKAFGPRVRHEETFRIQDRWIDHGRGLAVLAWDGYQEHHVICAGAYWIIHENCAYYGSGPSVAKNVQHAVIWKSLQLLKARGIKLVEMGQIDGQTEKEKGISKFKSGFGGTAMPYTVATRRRNDSG